MKLKALLLTLFAAGFAVSIAVAATPTAVEKGKPTVSVATTGTDTTGTATTSESRKEHAKQAAACKPAKKILVKGEFDAAAANGFSMKVTGGNHAAKALKGLQATVLVDDHTRFKGKKRSLAALAKGDRVAVQGYACKVDATTGAILARMVMTKGPKGADDDDDEAGTTTGATTTTAATTTAVTTTTP